MMLAPQSPVQIIARTGRDVHPPLYYLTLHYWLKLFGTSEAAARSLSAVFMLVTVILIYLIMKRLFSAKAASLAAIFTALGPFLVRYSQEARMYAMVAFLATLATFFLVYALDKGQPRWYYLYGLTIAAALYTHYYTVFVIAAHWLYVLYLEFAGNRSKPLQQIHWWLANVMALALFAPWLPVAYHQFTRVQQAFWIQPISSLTLPHTLSQFFAFTNNDWAGRWEIAATAALGGVVIWALWRGLRAKSSGLALIVLFTFVGPLAVMALSLRRPIYVDRYFVFAAVGFYALLAALIVSAKGRLMDKIRPAIALALCLVFAFGIKNVYAQSNHQMRTVAKVVNERFQPGDIVISGELYTYFDFSYYNHTGQVAKLLAPGGVNGYGESSLLYDRADQIVVKSYASIHPPSHHIWIVGKTGPHDYFAHIPANWTAVGPHFEAGYVAAQEYLVK